MGGAKTMNNMEAHIFLFLFCSLLVCSVHAQRSPKDLKNVLVILVDDGGFEASIYNNTKCKTPHLDELVKRSLVFNNAHTSVSSCSPSRSALLTGLPQHENGMYGLEQTFQHFSSFDGVRSLPWILNTTEEDIWYGIIGKKHVAPESVYPFPFSYTEQDGYNLNQVGRNITFMKELVHKFLSQVNNRRFFLYIAFFDAHRCSTDGKYGPFCEKFGDGSPGMGVIPDWNPVDYSPDDVEVPFFIQDTPQARKDLAAQYRSVSRMDQGVGLFMEALKEYGFDKNTLVIYTADNGIPFPDAKTNLYDPGMGEPMLVSNPLAHQRWGQVTDAMVSTTDVVPTILDWFGLPFPNYTLFGPNHVTLQGHSLLPITEKEPETGWDTVYASHNLHEVTMYYPMRVLRNKQYKLIRNLNYKMPYPLATDIYSSWTFQDLLNRTMSGEKTNWFKTLDSYYYRDHWELFDVQQDPHELKNLALNPAYHSIFTELKTQLQTWQNATNDPWICYPEGVMEVKNGVMQCGTLDNNS